MTTEIASTYDGFIGPDIDPSKWFYLEYPLPDGSSWVCREPSTIMTMADGRFTADIGRFELEHPVQVIDNCKLVLLSTQAFEIPATGTLTVSAELTATSADSNSDYRDGFASLIVIEPSSGMVFDIAATSDEVFAIHEQLPISESVRSFTRVTNDPLAGVATGAGVPHTCAMTLNATERSVQWAVDGTVIFDAKQIPIPQQIHVGMGIFTLHPVSGGASHSLRGQGLRASWSGISVVQS
ncbi:DUF6081 family protein [Jongsikchunia kroppenstedtii]|uniref:DUF6081 family protein n=1 Tax=Jongsikchunia kroppenstedtii TaxID=1121721 RepID=UPI0003673713|nr:DUF6081 family protein [Jongsikchunia kroppenstedtii]